MLCMHNTMYGTVRKSYPHLWWDQKYTFEQVFKAFLCKLQCYFLVKTSSHEKPMDVNPWISNCQLNCSSPKHHLFPIKQRNQNAPVNTNSWFFYNFNVSSSFKPCQRYKFVCEVLVSIFWFRLCTKTQVPIVLVKALKIWYLEEGKVLPKLVDTAIFFNVD